jgi:type VI secretion system secreted protein Hcp
MDLILLEPGDTSIFGSANNWSNGGSLIDNAANPTSKWLNPHTQKPIGQCIELVSVHQGIKQQLTSDVSNSARTSGRPVITEFTCVKYVDKTSVKFYEYCLQAKSLGGKDSPSHIYVCRNSGETTANIITFTLCDALISEIQFQSHPDDMPTEQFKLNFTEILWQYAVTKADTTNVGSIETGWSIARNRPIQKFS